ncbi:hypothetical protein PFMALIP_05833, partial [Plasmodium falciparum MaliPS096_E11]
MGKSYSKEEPKIVVPNDTYNSPRNVLENIGKVIKDKATSVAKKHEHFLKGQLENASFCGAYCKWIGVPKYGFSDPCYLYHMRHTNLLHEKVKDRDPCDGRNQKRFDENEGFECSKSRIKGNENNSDGGSCAPPRRRHMCDKNLEALNERNTKNIHDLLGNVLVTAKYEGQSIVNNHPHKETSDVCTALARSFADIGDIVRGRDMFKRNDKVENGLKKVFDKIHDGMEDEVKNDYNPDGSGNYYKLREDWWTANRNQVWRALTCGAGEKDTYFTYSKDNTQLFSNPKCGHSNGGAPPTNLDYVPQFLRWFEEWAEEFCRKRNIKLKNVKDACRDEEKGKYCGRNGYDCTQINRKETLPRGSKCTDCWAKCKLYEIWLDNQQEEFKKQKEMYKKEINGTNVSQDSKNNNINNKYYKDFYDKLKDENYKTVDKFINLLNEGKYCKNQKTEEENIDFKRTGEEEGTFYRSKYCQVCPFCGVECSDNKCTPKQEIYPSCENNKSYVPPRDAEATIINVLYSGDEQGGIIKKLTEFCNDPTNYNGKNYENWQCHYKRNEDIKCHMTNLKQKVPKHRGVMTFDEFFDFWVRNLLMDTISWENELKNCINNKNTEKCNKECNENCKCFEKWVKQKDDEWKKVKKVFENQNGTMQTYYNKLKSHFDNYFFLVINKINKGEEKWKKFTDELRNKIDSSKAKKGTNDAQDSIKLLLDHENKNAGTCLQNNPSEPCSKAEPQKSDENTQPQDTPPNPCGASGTTTSLEQICKDMKRYIKENNEKKKRNTGCNKKVYNGWDCESDIHRTHKGACMPPRRQKLCIYKLTRDEETENLDQLKMSFIKSAALETYLAWENYKGNNNEDYTQLQNGVIPEGFKRIMFYTFGDFRDLFFGTDMSNHHYINTLKEKVNKVLSEKIPSKNKESLSEKIPSKNKESLSDIKYQWWGKNGEDIWKGMLCGLTYDIQNGKNDIIEKLHKKHNYPCDLEVFASKPQFLRWFIEWSDEFCTERKKLEDKVGTACKSDYEGCEKEKNNTDCADACKKYKEYIDKKKVEYTSQAGIYNREKIQHKEEYKDILNDDASEYLKENCLDDTCDYMQKVKETKDYWTNPHKTYKDENLQKKCSCPPPPCEIVDKTLGDKTSKSYAEGCRHKYKTRGLEGWDCGNNGGESGKGKEDGDLCIPPRRRRLFLKKLHDLKGDETQVQLREAFIKSAAVETFFSWHEFKKEKEKEIKEKKERDGNSVFLYGHEQIVNDSDHPQNKLNGGNIPDEFKRQMFYTFGDYRDICLGKYIGYDMNEVNQKISDVFLKSGKPTGVPNNQERNKFWNKYAKDIWEGMLCALSYNTETKEMDKEMREKLTKPANSNHNIYNKVTISGGPSGDTNVENFASRPTYFRWLEEWGEEFCRKQTHKLEQIKDDCHRDNGSRHCDDDGFDCTKMVPNKDKIFEDLHCQSCAISCKSYEVWINTKKREFEKQEQKYEKEKKNVEGKIYDNYDAFYKNLKEYHTLSHFIASLKDGPCNNNNEDGTIDFNNNKVTFKHAKLCVACPVVGVKCKEYNCSKHKEFQCQDETITEEHMKNIETNNEVDIFVIDKTVNNFPPDLHVCTDKDIFEGIKENQWSCGYLCDLDICKVKTVKGDKNVEQYIPMRVLFKRWVEHFLKDYNKINDKISYCMKNDEVSKCINGCKDKCECVDKWIDHKRKEWERVRDRYLKPFDQEKSQIYFNVKTFLERLLPQIDVQKAIQPSKDLNEFERSSECTGDTNSHKDILVCLLDKLKEKMDKCKKQHDKKKQDCSDETPKTPATDIILPLESFPPPFCNVPANPCGNKDATNVVGVEEVAEILHQEAKDTMVKNSVVHGKGESGNGKSCLVGDITLAKFKDGASPSHLNENQICNINISHSNDKRGSKDGGPCTGKDGRYQMFKVKDGWKSGDTINTPYDVFLPPRREHFCTSNLENLRTGNRGLNDSNLASHSLLGDVLLAAKFEAEFIKKRYKDQSGYKDKETMCRAMKYSFADLGDIIKGTDLWEKNSGEQTTQRNLVTIFGKIKEGLPKEIQGKYTDNDKYLELRKDWWEANRAKIWEAMQCSLKDVSTSEGDCKYNTRGVPFDDYIPQRLRWMTEWAEWYCKYQSKEYDTLQKACKECRSKGGKCMNGEDMCKKCTQACKEYAKNIKIWEDQWIKIKTKYETLYKEGQNVANGETGTPSSGASKDENDVVAFLSKLHDKNKENKIYSTASGYIHQEAKYLDCNTQTQFCKHKNGVTSTSRTDKDKEYAFREKPHDHDDKCDCTDKTAPPSKNPEVPPRPALPEFPPPQQDPCEIVKDHFLIYKNGNGENGINGCHPKGGEFKWKCDDDHFVEEDGACMPPRRQKLCIRDLTVLTKDSSENDMRKAFINCAAKEIHFSWKKYKYDKKNENPNGGKEQDADKIQNQLKYGNIPEEFKRQMFYTFGDYRDICLGTDISSDSNIKGISRKVKDILNSQNGKTHEQNITPESWWKSIEKEVWKGMLCILTNEIGDNQERKNKILQDPKYKDPPEVFAKRVQFLRWFVEWGDEYCQKRGELEKKVKQSCKDVNTGYKKKNNSSCAEACKEYKEYITNKKGEYNTQKDKFQSDKNQKKPGYNNISSEVASDYLKEKCLHKKCDCIGKVNSTSDYWDKPFKTYDDNTLKSNCDTAISPHSSLSQKGKMSCVEQIAKELREKAEKNVEKIDNSMKGNESKFNGTCNLIKKQTDNNGQTTCDFNKRYPNGITSLDSSCDNNGKKRFNIEEEWKCDEDITDGKNKLCIPPRRRDICLNKLKNISISNISDSKTLLVKIQDVAKNEGNDIIKNLLPENPCNESVICDAMKYSFADIGDIIRGRSKIKPNNGDNIEGELQNIFRKIQNNTTSLKSIELTEFREKWWDANRKEVWKAMTCNAPNDAHLKKKKNNPGNKSQIIASQTEQTKKCSHDSEPPDYDYIPERYRFLQEWSEYYCKVLKEKQYEMKNNCEQCKTKNVMCENDNNNSCNECKNKCKIYKELVNQWESQFDGQNQIYKRLYMNAKTAISTDANSDSSIKFLKKLEESCDNPYSAEKYLDISTHCTDYKFSETNNNGSNYAFSLYPNKYKKACKCLGKSTSGSDNNLTSFIQNSLNFPKIPGLKKVTNIVPRLPVPIIDLIPDPHTIHKIVAESLETVIPKFHINVDKTDVAPPTNNILNDVLPSAIPVGIALALTSIAFLYLK